MRTMTRTLLIMLFIAVVFSGVSAIAGDIPIPPEGYKIISIHPADDLWVVRDNDGKESYFEATSQRIWSIADVNSAIDRGDIDAVPYGFRAWSYSGNRVWISKHHGDKFGKIVSEQPVVDPLTKIIVNWIFLIVAVVSMIFCCIHLHLRTKKGLHFKPQPF